MAQRLATEYVKVSLTLTEEELASLRKLMEDQGVKHRVMVTGNGNQQLEFRDKSGEDLFICFQRRGKHWVSEGSYRLGTLALANVMRQAISLFKGDAIVNRIYSNFTMVYYYERGTVVKIVELGEHGQKTIYEFKSMQSRLEQLYYNKLTESEIVLVKEQVNHLLDERNRAESEEKLEQVDNRLSELTHRLFVLEA